MSKQVNVKVEDVYKRQVLVHWRIGFTASRYHQQSSEQHSYGRNLCQRL